MSVVNEFHVVSRHVCVVARAMFGIRCNSQQCIQGTDAGPRCAVLPSAQSRLEDLLSGTFEAAEGPAPDRT
jgi:hypothetical protein